MKKDEPTIAAKIEMIGMLLEDGVFSDEEIKEAVGIDYPIAQMRALRYNDNKPQLSLIPLDVLDETAKVLAFGMKKYGRDNWRKGQPVEQILDSMLRHMAAIQRGEIIDSESGLRHSAHITCNAFFLEHAYQTEIHNEFTDAQSGTETLENRKP